MKEAMPFGDLIIKIKILKFSPKILSREWTDKQHIRRKYVQDTSDKIIIQNIQKTLITQQ